MIKPERIIPHLIVPSGDKISLQKDFDPAWIPEGLGKREARKGLQGDIQLLTRYQDMLYAQNNYALLIIFQAMDAAGKDSTIKHVMSGLNPQGCQVHSFKAPSPEELDHDYLWRCSKALPERGRIGIFNRSYYEEVLVVRVHPEILKRQQLPGGSADKGIWRRRFREINHFERYLAANGIVILKFFLHVSKDEQKKRFLERIDRPEKNWKFSAADARERSFWDDYMKAYEDVLNNTSTRWAPWHVVPADHKWVTHLAVGAVICHAMSRLKPAYPRVSEAHLQQLRKARQMLESEAVITGG